MGLPLFIKFIISLLLGSVIGLERESVNTKKPELWTLGGVRTFALISFLGSISGFLFLNKDFALSNIISIFVFIAILVYYTITALHIHTTGLTTEISAIFAYLIGWFVITNLIPLPITIALSIILVLILSNKTKSKKIATNINKNEWNSFMSFAIILLVILPFLPDIGYRITDITILNNLPLPLQLFNLEIINPYHLWLIVVLISGINLLGYLLSKKLGKSKGIYLCSFFGGIMSSTLVNQTLSEKSRIESKDKQKQLVISNIVAYIASVFHIAFFVGILNLTLLWRIIPLLLLITIVCWISILYLQGKKPKVCKAKFEMPFKEKPELFLIPAIKFSLLITGIKILAGIVLVFLGNNGFLGFSLISSLVGLDAVLINISELAGNSLTFNYAIFVILLINIFNLFGKWLYSYWKGSKAFSRLTGLVFLAISFVSLLWYLYII